MDSTKPFVAKRDEDGPEPAVEVAPWPAVSRAADLRFLTNRADVAARSRWFPGFMAAAVAGHAGLLLALFYLLRSVSIGAGGIELEAISVEMVSSSVFESRTPDRNATASITAETRPVQAYDGPNEPGDAADQTVEQQESVAVVVEPKRRDSEVSAEPPAADTASDSSKAEQQDKTSQSPDQRPKEDDAATQSAPAEAAQSGGGAASRGMDQMKTVEAAAAASVGRSSAYSRSVVETLARARPKASPGERGTVRIAFTIGPGGEVSTVQVLQSSGRLVIDGAAVEAVRGARFPAPPAGLTAKDLSFEIPYYFR